MPIRRGLYDRIQEWSDQASDRTVIVTIVGLLIAIALIGLVITAILSAWPGRLPWQR